MVHTKDGAELKMKEKMHTLSNLPINIKKQYSYI
jgi:hypothetical protein